MGDVEFPEVEDVLFNCCYERIEASGGWRATKIGLQHAGLKINLRICNAVLSFIESFPFN